MSVGIVGDSCDSALAKTAIELFKTEIVKHLGPWKTKGQIEWETMKWVHRYNKDQMYGAIRCQIKNKRRTHSAKKQRG